MAIGFNWYVHDHLYSTAALIKYDGSVLERYEYDAYGNCNILEPNFADDEDGISDYANPYAFQGKRLDLLDNGGLKLMYWPYRDYSTYIGRWLQVEKLGMIPNDESSINPFAVLKQYMDGMNLYNVFSSNPVLFGDPLGLLPIECIPDMRRRKILPSPRSSGSNCKYCCNWLEKLLCLWREKSAPIFMDQICGLIWQLPNGDCVYLCVLHYSVFAECVFLDKVCEQDKDAWLINVRIRTWPMSLVDVWGMNVCPGATGGPDVPPIQLTSIQDLSL